LQAPAPRAPAPVAPAPAPAPAVTVEQTTDLVKNILDILSPVEVVAKEVVPAKVEVPVAEKIVYEQTEPKELIKQPVVAEKLVAVETVKTTEETKSLLKDILSALGQVPEVVKVPEVAKVVEEKAFDVNKFAEDLSVEVAENGYDEDFVKAVDSLKSLSVVTETTATTVTGTVATTVTETTAETVATTVATGEVVDGSVDTDEDGVSDVAEKNAGTNPDFADLKATDVYFGVSAGGGVQNVPVVTAGTLKNVAVMSSSGGMLPGKYKPNKKVTIEVKNRDGNVLTQLVSSTDNEGKFLAPLGSLMSNGVNEGDVLVLTIKSESGEKGDPMLIKIGKTEAAPKIEIAGSGVERLAVDPDELDYEEALPEQWHDVVKNDFVATIIKGTKFEKNFIAALSELKFKQGAVKVFSGIASPGTTVAFMFESLITTSVVISDADGKFSVSAPKGLEAGLHKYTGFVTNLKNSSVSAPVRGVMKLVNPSKIIDDMLMKIQG